MSKLVVRSLELLAQPLDMAVDCAVVDIDLIVVGGVHERVAALHHARAAGKRLQNRNSVTVSVTGSFFQVQV